MTDELIGIERDVVLNTLIQDKSQIVIFPVVKTGFSVEKMTLQSNEYKIYPQGILFFKRFLHHWKAIDDLLKNPANGSVRMNISFSHRGRGLYFISVLNRVRNGYALMLPSQVYKITEEKKDIFDEVSAKIFFEGFSNVYSRCEQSKNFTLFENNPWLYFSQKDFECSKEVLKNAASLEKVQLSQHCTKIMYDTKLLLYIPEKKIPKWNFFPFPVTVTEELVSYSIKKLVEDEVSSCIHPLYIPLCESPNANIHSILGLKAKVLLLTPSDVQDTLLLLPVCRFLSQQIDANPLAVESNTLTIVCISETSIVLGYLRPKKKNAIDFPLVKGQEYTLQLCVPVENLVRTITTKISVMNIYNNGLQATCGVCRFLNLQEEDRRFLHEKYYGTVHK